MHAMQNIILHFAEKPFHDIPVFQEFGVEIVAIERDEAFYLKMWKKI